jgi:hypothetical protein
MHTGGRTEQNRTEWMESMGEDAGLPVHSDGTAIHHVGDCKELRAGERWVRVRRPPSRLTNEHVRLRGNRSVELT